MWTLRSGGQSQGGGATHVRGPAHGTARRLIDRQSPIALIPESPAVEWDWDIDSSPECLAFSEDRMTIATSTATNVEGKAKIRLLKKVGSKWRYLGSQPVPVFASTERDGKGITGLALYVPQQSIPKYISFRRDQSVTLSIDSTYELARDCYQVLVAESQETFELSPSNQIMPVKERTNLALAIWKKSEIVILLNKQCISTSLR